MTYAGRAETPGQYILHGGVNREWFLKITSYAMCIIFISMPLRMDFTVMTAEAAER